MALLLASLAAGAYVDSVARELYALEAELLSVERVTVPDKCFPTVDLASAAADWESKCEKQTTNKMLLRSGDARKRCSRAGVTLCADAGGSRNRREGRRAEKNVDKDVVPRNGRTDQRGVMAELCGERQTDGNCAAGSIIDQASHHLHLLRDTLDDASDNVKSYDSAMLKARRPTII